MSCKVGFSELNYWQKVVEKTYPIHFREVGNQKNKIHFAYNGKMYANSPYITDGGAINVDNELLGKIKELKKPTLLKTRNQIDVNSDNFIISEDYITYVLDISGGKDFVWNNLVKSKTRNQVRKAEKVDYQVKIGGSELLDDFYQVISTAWRDLGTPTHSKTFYKNIVGFSDENVEAQFIVLYLNQKPVSCACLIMCDETIYHPYAATLKEYNRLSLNNALYWEIIQYGIQRDMKSFDMGRSKKGQGTARYKKSWGSNEVQLYYYYFNQKKVENIDENKVVLFLTNVWKKLPLFITNRIGSKFIYKVL